MENEVKIKWYDRGWFLFLLLVVVPYIGIPYLWIRKREMGLPQKITLSLVFGFWIIITRPTPTPTNSDITVDASDSIQATSKSSISEEAKIISPNKDEIITKSSLTPTEEAKKKISDLVFYRISEGYYSNVTVSDVTVNKNLGSDDDTYILIVRGEFNVQNTKKTANEVLRMYSDDLMATLAEKGVDNIAESAIMWEDEYNDRTVKYSYSYDSGNFYLSDSFGE